MDLNTSPSVTQKAFIIEVDGDDNDDTEESANEEKETKFKRAESPIVKQRAAPPDKQEKMPHTDIPSFDQSQGEPQIACFTCFLGPCPEVINANFKHPEFMICYRDCNSGCDSNNMMRYYCCPLYLAAINKDGEETFELRAVKTEANVNSNHFDFHNMNGNYHNTNSSHDWSKFYGQNQPHANMSHHSFSQHHFNCRQLPPQFNFLHHCSCSCPPQMMYYLNYRFQMPQQQQQHMQQPNLQQTYRQFAYRPSYAFPTPGSAMG